ncbi:hypothetical protein N0V84_000603 [Fusarium piperis]|uniref:WW domain-containing protein n=1 Tax=Fusarium piperis TaxID=1435070 RepID=A0A9W8WMV0_9HYPO|nr:hypothetical protein N0V84_000603 [Fusarium piperis]
MRITITNPSGSSEKDKKQAPNPDIFESLENSPDITHVKDKFPKVKDEPWLAQRLGNGITRRRMIFRHRQTQDTRSATTGDIGPNDVADQLSILSLASSSASSSDEAMNQRIPDLEDLTFNEKKLKYGEPIECPYCGATQVLNTQHEWRQRSRKHVFSDLQPYVCTLKDCSSGLFTTQKEWITHETTAHLQKWMCAHCDDHEKPAFEDIVKIKDHLKVTHDVAEENLAEALEASRVPLKPFEASSCPLCNDWEPPARTTQNVKEFYQHLGKHQQILALEALPMSRLPRQIKLSTPLPPRWEVKVAPDGERVYFVDHNDGITTWVDPRSTEARLIARTLSMGPLPPGWEARLVRETEHIYFVDHNAGITTWDDPRAKPEAEESGFPPEGINKRDSHL